MNKGPKFYLLITILGVQVSALNGILQNGLECRPIADVIFLLDGSDSISDEEFSQQIEFIRRFVQLSDVGPSSIRVGLVVVSSAIGDEFPLSNTLTKEQIIQKLIEISQPQEGSRIDIGLVQMEQRFGTYGRPGVTRVGVLLTDGRAKYLRATQEEARVIKDTGVFLVAIGVGRLVKYKELEKIASTPNNAYKLLPLELSTKNLVESVEFRGKETCTGHMLLDRLSVFSNKPLQDSIGEPPIQQRSQVQLPESNIETLTDTSTIVSVISQFPIPTPYINYTEYPVKENVNVIIQSLADVVMPFLTQITKEKETNISFSDPNKNGTLYGMSENNTESQPKFASFVKLFDTGLNFNALDSYINVRAPLMGHRNVETSAVNQTTTTIAPQNQDLQSTTNEITAERCPNGQFVNGVGYNFKPDTCVEFFQCFMENGVVRTQTARCPFETFFDEENPGCRHYANAPCWRDPCFHYNIHSYAHGNNCRSYWTCSDGVSVPTCCPLGTSYVPERGCTRNVTCTDICMDFGDLKTVTMTLNCKLLPMEEDSRFYYELVAGVGWLIRMCAQGSRYDKTMCRCVAMEETAKDKCKPELYLDFQFGLEDKSGNNLAMNRVNVEIDGSTGYFNGRAHIKLWRFSGMSLGQHVTISFRFRTSVTAPKGKLMHIVSNCCFNCEGDPKPSLDIAVIPSDRGGVAVFSTTTRQAGEIFMFIPYQDSMTGWNTIQYSYDGLKVTGNVNNQSTQKHIVGNIAERDALTIGTCGVQGFYNGYIDEFKFYMCNL